MAAQDAELKLKVSLDLAFFKQRLAEIGSQLGGQPLQLNVKFDRSAITKELRNLERAIGKKKINVELNLLGGLTKDQFEKIQGRLEALSKTKKVEIPVSVKNGATGRDIQDAITGIRQRIEANQQIRQGGGKLRVATSIKPSIANADVSEFKKVVQQKLSGISAKVKAEVESNTPDALVAKVEKLKENLGKLAGEKIALDVEVASNIDDVHKSIKGKLTSVGIKTELVEPVNVGDFIRDVAKKVDDQLKKSYTAGGISIATKLALPGLTDPLKALQKNLNQKDPLRAKLGTVASIKKTDVTALQAAVNEKFKDITVKVRAELDTAAAATQVPAAGSSRTFLQTLKDLDKAVLQSVYRAAGEDALLAFDEGIINNKTKMIQALSRAAEDASAGFIAALENKKSALFKAAGEYGGALLGGLKKTLKIQSPSREMFDIGDDAGKGFELGLLKAMELAEKSATNQMRRMLDRLARMALMMGGMSAEQINRQVAQARALPGLDFPATVPPRQRIPIGPSSTGRTLPAGRAAAGLIGAAQGPAGLLPSMTKQSELTMGLEALVQALVSQSRGRGPKGPGAIVSMESGFIPVMRERFAKAAERYLFGVETQVVDLFDAALRQVESAVDLHIARIQGQISQRMRSAVSVADLGVQGRPILSASRIAGLLPAGVGREPSRYATGAIGGETREQMMARRTAEAYARSALRGMDVMGGSAGRPPSPYSYAYRSARPTSAIVPYAAGGAMVPAPPMAGGGGVAPPSGGGGGGRGGFGGFGGFGRAIGGINLPGAGTIRELGSEFAFATKQVLLFGQAYKMLGFLQDFPGQVGQAVAQLQTFRNTLGAVSTSAEDAAESNQMILDLVDKYNVPLQSARDGFTKLYASMAPAGFSGDEIRDLFTGITQAAATFGMSADKVDRVNYAFAQMASKGQVMSEELKGQLGDVLPGAMAIFAEAAGFEGPKAIQEFSAALEDGVYKGEAMNVLLKNVGIVMKQEFGPGAEGAARTFQGVINRMQNSMQLLYESFEPVAIGFLNSVVMPLTDGIKTVSDGFTAFFTGAAAKTSGGFAIAQELEKLRPALDGIRQNISELAEQFGQFARVAGEVGKVFLQIAGNPLVGYLVKLYAIALPINMALNVMRGLWISNAAQLLIFNARVAAGTSTLSAFRGMMANTGATAQVTANSIRAAGTTLRAFFSATGVGIVVVGISMLIEKFMSMNQALEDTRAKALGAAQAIRAMSQTEAMQAKRSAESGVRLLETLQQRGPSYPGSESVSITEKEGQQLRGLGIPVSRTLGGFRAPIAMLESYKQRLQTVNIAEAESRIQQLDFEGQQAMQTTGLAPIPSVAGEEKASKGKGARKSLDQLVSSQILMLADAEKAAIKYAKAQTEALAPDTAQAQRMLEYYVRFRNNLVDIQAIEGQIAATEKNRGKWIREYGMTGEEIDRNLAELRNQLKIATIDLATAEQDYRNQAKADAADEAAEMQEKIRKQKELNRLIEDAKIAAGIIPSQQAAIIQQQRGFEDARARVQAEGTPEQLAQLTAAQALIPQAGSVQEYIKGLRDELQQLISVQNLAAVSARGIGEALGEAMTTGVASLISGTATAKEVFANFLQSVGQALSQAASQMIATYISIGIAKMFAGLSGGGLFGGNASIQGGGFGSFTGGSFGTGGVADLPGLSGAGVLAGGSSIPSYAGLKFASGGIAQGGFRAFANGGVVSGPTLGLVGEGKYNEAIVPLPDGKSIPVQMRGGQSSRDLLSNGAQSQSSSPVLSMSFQSTTINGVEYVSRDQLDAAMMETRKLAARDGANRGASLALDRLQNSPNARRRVGI